MIETRCLKNVIFVQRILSFVLSIKIINLIFFYIFLKTKILAHFVKNLNLLCLPKKKFLKIFLIFT